MILLENNWGKVRCPHCDSVMKPEKEDSEEYAENPVIYRILKGIKVHK